jgi:phosphoglycerate dehydrogenase-like enzyme
VSGGSTIKPKLAVLDDWQKIARRSADWSPLVARADVHFFEAPFADEDDAVRRLADFDIVLAIRERTPFPSSLVARLPKLKMFGLTGARAALIDTSAMVVRGITVCYTGGGPSGSSTAELALGLMLAAARGIPAGDAAVRAGRFQSGTEAGPVLDGKTIGLIGLGRIGSRMAAYCNALGMKVLAWSQNLTAETAAAAGAVRVAKEALLSAADVVSLHLVLSDRTRGILGAAELARMRFGAILVNTARAQLVDEAALVAAVESGRLTAALDVYYREPLPAGHPLARAPNVVLTPHLGYSAIEVYREYYQHSVENALAFLDGKPIRVLQGPGE